MTGSHEANLGRYVQITIRTPVGGGIKCFASCMLIGGDMVGVTVDSEKIAVEKMGSSCFHRTLVLNRQVLAYFGKTGASNVGGVCRWCRVVCS